jgi:hypothetical protein
VGWARTDLAKFARSPPWNLGHLELRIEESRHADPGQYISDKLVEGMTTIKTNRSRFRDGPGPKTISALLYNLPALKTETDRDTYLRTVQTRLDAITGHKDNKVSVG